MSIVILGIDLGKNSCSIVGLDAKGGSLERACETRTDPDAIFAALVHRAKSGNRAVNCQTTWGSRLKGLSSRTE